MTEEAIESTFTSRDWRETTCAHCVEYGSCVSMADVPACYRCLEQFYDEDGEPLAMNVYQPTTQELYDELAPDFSPEALYEKAGLVLSTPKAKIAQNVILGMAGAFVTGALFMACLLIDESEISAFTTAILGY